MGLQPLKIGFVAQPFLAMPLGSPIFDFRISNFSLAFSL
jgi:hypothetical protein